MAGDLTVGAVHQNQALTNIAISYKNQAFVAERVFPIVRVVKEADVYYIFGKEELIDYDFLRAAGTEAKEVTWVPTTATYSAEEYALKKIVPDRIVNNSDVAVRPMVTTATKLTKWLNLSWERRVQALAQNTGNATSSATPSPKWNGTSPDIEKDVDTAKDTVRKAAGVEPNSILMNASVRDAVKRDSTVRNLIRYTVPAYELLKSGDLPPVLWNLEVIIAGAIRNTANENATESLANIWTDTVCVFYKENTPSLDTLTWGYSLRVADFSAKTYREEKRAGTFVEMSMIQDEKVVASACAYLILDTLHGE